MAKVDLKNIDKNISVDVQKLLHMAYNEGIEIDLGDEASEWATLYEVESESDDGAVSVQPFQFKTVMSGAGGVGGRAYFYMKAEAVLGGWANALKAEVDFGDEGGVTGLGSALVAELTLPTAAVAGNYTPLELELNVPDGAVFGAKTSLIYASVQGTDVAEFDTNGYVLTLNGVSVGSGKVFQENTAADATHALRISVDGTDYFIMLTDSNA